VAQPTHAPLDTGTRLAVDRTWLAHERTLMAWIRTAASLISFGFSIYKFFDIQTAGREIPGAGLIGPREFSLLLIGMGLAALMLGFLQHRQSVRVLRRTYGDIEPQSISSFVAVMVSVLGTVAILLVLLRQ
jgi:putative membrane protein